MNIEKFKETASVTYVLVWAFYNNSSQHPFRGYVEVPYSFEDFSSLNERQQQAVCQAVVLKQTGGILQGFMKCDPDEFYRTTNH